MSCQLWVVFHMISELGQQKFSFSKMKRKRVANINIVSFPTFRFVLCNSTQQISFQIFTLQTELIFILSTDFRNSNNRDRDCLAWINSLLWKLLATISSRILKNRKIFNRKLWKWNKIYFRFVISFFFLADP